MLNLATVQTAPRTIAAQNLAGVEQKTAEVIASIPRLGDGELLDVRTQARAMGQCAWQIECAVDAEVLNRFTARAGRRPDTEGRGVTAAVERHARTLGIDPVTVFLNAKIHNTFFATCHATSSELEKSFYKIALRSPEPRATIEKIAQAKKLNPTFSVRDAERLVRPPAPPAETQPAPPPSEIPAIQEAWARYREVLDELCRVTSGAGVSLRHTLEAHRQELWHEISQPQPDESRAVQSRTLAEALERLAKHYPFYRIQLRAAKAAVAVKAGRTLAADEQEIVDLLTEGWGTVQEMHEHSPSKISRAQIDKLLHELKSIGFVDCGRKPVEDKVGSGGTTSYNVWTL
jgi:hypothetical protein